MVSGYCSCPPPAEQRQRSLDRGLIRLAEHAEAGQRFLRILALAQDERIEAAARQEEQLVAEDVADGAQLALPAVALAQQPRRGKAAAIAHLGEVHRHYLEVSKVAGDCSRLLVAVQPDTETPGPAKQRIAPL